MASRRLADREDGFVVSLLAMTVCYQKHWIPDQAGHDTGVVIPACPALTQRKGNPDLYLQAKQVIGKRTNNNFKITNKHQI